MKLKKVLVTVCSNGHAVRCEAIDLGASSGSSDWSHSENAEDEDDSDDFPSDALVEESFEDVHLQLWFQEERTLYRTRSHTLQADPELMSFVMFVSYSIVVSITSSKPPPFLYTIRET